MEDSDGLRISVTDDGRGMPATVGRGGMGLRIMQHRCGLIEASFDIRSADPHGTAVEIRLYRNPKRDVTA